MAEAFGERLRKVREQKRLSQSELAEKTGFQASAISHFESGRRSPSLENLKRLADALAVHIDFLLGRQPDVGATGPIAQELLQHFGQLSAKEQENVADFAKMLAEKKRDRQQRG